MSKHQTKTSQQITCERIRQRIEALVEPWTEVVTQRFRPDDIRAPLVVRTTNVHHPPLLEQLANPEPGSTAGAGASSPSSRAAANLGGLAVLQQLDAEARIWLDRVDPRWSRRGIEAALWAIATGAHQAQESALRYEVADVLARLTATTEDRVRRIAQAAGTLTDEALWNLDREVMRWWANARVATTWGDPPLKPHVPCPECRAMGKLQVQLNPTVAVCIECGTAWDGLTIEALGAAVQMLAEHDAVERAARQIEERPCALCGEVHALTPDDELHTPVSMSGVMTRDRVVTAGGEAVG
jgi:hypothetical protein